MRNADWLQGASPAFRLAIATSWLAPDSWRQNQERAIREAIAAGPDWTEVLSLVVRHQTPALSWAALNRVPEIAVPELAKRELRKLSDACRIQGTQDSLLLVDVLKRLNRAGIPVMPLKGPVLSFELYGDVGLRQSTDLDLQVPREDLHRAIACLESTGWQPGYGFRAMSPRQRESFLRNGYEVQLRHSRTGCWLELHWRNHWETPDATSARWARSTPSVWQGQSIRSMNGGDLALFLCVHGAYHVWSNAKWLSDVARAHSIGRIDWRAAMDEARGSGVEAVCPAALSLLQSLYGFEVPTQPGFAPDRTGARPSQLLVEMPLETLKLSQDPRGRIGLALLRNHTRMIRYERLVRPRTTWRESLTELFYCQQDFAMLPLPDSFFWAYKPLRPVLWLWRWAWQAGRQTLARNSLRVDR